MIKAIKRMKDRKRIEELILRVQRGSASEEERESLQAWCAAAPRNARYHRDFVALLTEAEVVGRAQASAVPAPTLEEIVARAEGTERNLSIGTKRARFRGRTGAALLAAAAVGALALFLPPYLSHPASDFVLGSGEIVTGAGESTTVTLGDGTVVRLAPRSRLVISGKGDAREVWLSGRAFFAVRHMDGLPFRVRTHAGDALVLGTRFDIATSEEELRVLVVEGAVQLQGANRSGEEVKIAANQLGRVAEASPPILEDVGQAYVDAELGWLGDFLAFEATPLHQVARELERRFGVQVQVLDSTLAQETVRGLFMDESLDEVVEVVCRAVAADCAVRSTGVTISP